MTKELRGVWYADRGWHATVRIEENLPLARDTYRIRLPCPEIAAAVLPGQFVMVRLADCEDPLLGRPFALYDVVAGAPLEVWGPLGNGFPAVPTEHLVMVAGGIGQTPFLALAREYLGQRTYGDPPRNVPAAKNVTLCYGARTKDYLAGLTDFEQAGVDVRVNTEDGSAGHCGLVTDLVRPVVRQSPHACRIVCCGPEPMMQATAKIADELGVPCQVSLETPMACGIGICFSCVAKVRDASGGWDYRRTCVEGPVFDAHDVEF
jgi:dihydroorotate dehydrogenase electron transfer subunit